MWTCIKLKWVSFLWYIIVSIYAYNLYVLRHGLYNVVYLVQPLDWLHRHSRRCCSYSFDYGYIIYLKAFYEFVITNKLRDKLNVFLRRIKYVMYMQIYIRKHFIRICKEHGMEGRFIWFMKAFFLRLDRGSTIKSRPVDL